MTVRLDGLHLLRREDAYVDQFLAVGNAVVEVDP